MPKQVTLNIGINRPFHNPGVPGRKKVIEHKNLQRVRFKGLTLEDTLEVMHPRVKAYVTRYYPGWKITGYAPYKRPQRAPNRNHAPRPLTLFANHIDLQDAHRDLRRDKDEGREGPRLLLTPGQATAEHLACNVKVAVIPLTKRNGLTLTRILRALQVYRAWEANQL
jgi:hypothetical protein